MNSHVMLESQSVSALGMGKPEGLMLKDVLKPSGLFIVLQWCCLLFCFYFFILKPALNKSNPFDISLTKETYSYPLGSQKLKFKTELDTNLTADSFVPSEQVLSNEEKFEVVHLNNPTLHTKSTRESISIKSTKTNITKSEKVLLANSHDSFGLPNRYKQKKKHKYMSVRNHDQEEYLALKIKSFAVNLKESFFTPATMPVCTQVQIAMNQCANYSS